MEPGFNKEKFLSRLLIGLAILYFFVGINFDMNIYDEGIGLVGAERVGMGQTPYLDFFTIYAPFNYYLTAAYSLLFGGSVMSPRFLSMIFFVFALAGAHRIIKKSNDKNVMFIPGLVIMITLGYSLFFARPMAAAIMFSVFALLFTINQIYEEEYIWPDDNDEEPTVKPKPLTKYLILSGVMTGFVIITRLYMGVFLLSSIAAAVFLTFDIPLKDRFRAFGKILLGVLIIATPMFVYLLMMVPFDMLYEQLVYIPFNVFPDYRSLPFPQILDFQNIADTNSKLLSLWLGVYVYLPALVFAVTFYLFFKRKTINLSTDRIKAALPVAFFSFLLLFQASVRPDIEHLIPAWLFSLLAVFILIDFKNNDQIMKYIAILIVIGFVLMPVHYKIDLIRQLNSPEYVQIKGIARAERFKINKDWYEDLNRAVAYIKKHTKKSDLIFVCNERNDKGYRNDALFYFLAERLPATRYHELHPGVTSTKPVQEEMIKELQSNNVKYIVRVSGLNEKEEPNLSSVSSGIRLLDDYIDKHYIVREIFGTYEILSKKAGAN